MKKISILTRSIPLHGPGGMERSTWLVATGLAEAGWEVEAITTGLPSGQTEEGRDGVLIRAIPDSLPARYSGAFYQGARKVLAEGPKDSPVLAVSAAGFDYLSLPPARRRPVALVSHGTSWDEIRSKWAAPSFRSMVGLARQVSWLPRDVAAYRRTERIITVNDPITAQITQLLPTAHRKKVFTIYNGIQAEAVPDRDPAVADKFVVCTSGRLVREKGIHLLLEACAQLPAAHQPDRIMICGDGPFRTFLQTRAAELALRQVVFTGHLSDVTPVLRAASVLVLPSLRREGLPMSVLEALAVGCPAIIPDSLAFPHVTQPGLLRFRTGNIPDLARALAAARHEGFHHGLATELSFETMIHRYAEVLSGLSACAIAAVPSEPERAKFPPS
jgi:glycosyltransferase involved in cell wall biosynthesis